MLIVDVTSLPCQEITQVWPSLVARKMTPRWRKSGYRLLLGCRSTLDRVSDKKTFFSRCSNKKKWQKPAENLHHMFGYPIAIDRAWWISRVGSLVACESRERRDKIFAEKRQFWPECFQILEQKQPFFSRNFHFLAAAEEPVFLGGGISSNMASQYPSWGIYKHAPPAFWRKR